MPESRLIVSRAEAEGRIKKLIREGDEVRGADYRDDSAQRWFARAKAAIASVYEGDVEAGEFYRWSQIPGGSDGAINTLHSLIERLEYAAPPRSFGERVAQGVSVSGSVSESSPRRDDGPSRQRGRRVFVVHGRNAAHRAEVARTLQTLGLKPVILSEQTNEGRTLIEKFEANALNVDFAVVILSADDRGAGNDGEVPDKPNRARQNVLLELGYFISKLGRPRVVALSELGVELPSDLHGLVFTPIDDAGAWRFALGRELRAAGYEVDLNRLG